MCDHIELSTIGVIRPATEADVPAIIELEHQCFPFPWPEGAFYQELKNAWSSLEVLVEPGGSIVGFIVYWIVEDELHLLDIAVHPSLQKRGVGRALMLRLEEICASDGLTFLTLEVRESNDRAIRLYTKMGYDVIHKRKKYYVDNQEDALVMAKVVGENDKPS